MERRGLQGATKSGADRAPFQASRASGWWGHSQGFHAVETTSRRGLNIADPGQQ